MPIYFDYTYILVVIGGIISMIASSKMQSTFNKYARIRSASGLTGEQTARMILDSNGLSNVRIIPISGSLTDHYNPTNKTIALSETVINSTSIAAVSVAAHECGHAVQDLRGYTPYLVRAKIVPVVNFASQISIPILMIGLFMSYFNFLLPIGIALFSFTLIFQIVTLPVEFDASFRALDLLLGKGILSNNEIGSSKKVLRAAALTYVAGVITSFLTLLRYIIIYNSRNRRD